MYKTLGYVLALCCLTTTAWANKDDADTVDVAAAASVCHDSRVTDQSGRITFMAYLDLLQKQLRKQDHQKAQNLTHCKRAACICCIPTCGASMCCLTAKAIEVEDWGLAAKKLDSLITGLRVLQKYKDSINANQDATNRLGKLQVDAADQKSITDAYALLKEEVHFKSIDIELNRSILSGPSFEETGRSLNPTFVINTLFDVPLIHVSQVENPLIMGTHQGENLRIYDGGMVINVLRILSDSIRENEILSKAFYERSQRIHPANTGHSQKRF